MDQCFYLIFKQNFVLKLAFEDEWFGVGSPQNSVYVLCLQWLLCLRWRSTAVHLGSAIISNLVTCPWLFSSSHNTPILEAYLYSSIIWQRWLQFALLRSRFRGFLWGRSRRIILQLEYVHDCIYSYLYSELMRLFPKDELNFSSCSKLHSTGYSVTSSNSHSMELLFFLISTHHLTIYPPTIPLILLLLQKETTQRR